MVIFYAGSENEVPSQRPIAFQIGDLGFRGHQTYPYNRRRRIELPRLYYVLRPGLRAAGAGGGDVK